jgi:O-antigen ligase
MPGSSVIGLAIVAILVAVIIALPIFLRWPWLAVLLPWIIPLLKMYLLLYVPITRVIDISLVIFGFLIIFLGFGFLLKKLAWDSRYTVLVLLHLAVAAALSISYTWTSAPNYGLRKLGLFAIFNTICFVLGVSTVRSMADARKMAKAFSILVLVVSVSMLIAPTYKYGAEYQLRQAFGEANPLNAAYALAAGAIGSLIWLEKGKRWAALAFVIWILALVATYKTGSRAMLGQIFIGTIMLSMIYKGSHRLARITVVWIAVVLGIVAGVKYAAQRETRVFGFFEDPTYWFEQSKRPYLWAAAIEGVPERPFLGHGVGAFAVNVMGADRMEFPHNFFLEVLYEGGIISFGLFTLFWVFLGYYLLRWRRTTYRYTTSGKPYVQELWVAIFVASGLASVMHWDISGQRLLWLLAGIALGTARASWQEATFQWQDDEQYYLIDAQAERESDTHAVYV